MLHVVVPLLWRKLLTCEPVYCCLHFVLGKRRENWARMGDGGGLVFPKHVTIEVDTIAQAAMEFNLNLAWPVDEPKKLGSTTFALTPETNDTLSVEGDFSIYAEDVVIYDKFAAADDVQIECNIDNGAGDTISINVPVTRLTGATGHVEGRSRQAQSVGFKGLASGSAATDPIQITCVNGQSADAFVIV